MNVVVVESPAKAKAINKYLGNDFVVLASFGHVRDLPSKDGSVLPDKDFTMAWEVDAKSKKRIRDIADAVKKSHKLFLATDPDREGEAISWHVYELLNEAKALKDVEVKRVVFNEITKQAVLKAMEHRPPRAGLSRGLHALPDPVAQAAGLAFGRPRAIRRAPADLRPGSGDRGLTQEWRGFVQGVENLIGKEEAE